MQNVRTKILIRNYLVCKSFAFSNQKTDTGRLKCEKKVIQLYAV